MSFNRITSSLVLAFLPAILLASCSKPSSSTPSDTPKDKMSFTQNELTVFVGEELAIPVTYEKYDRGIYVKASYDFASNPGAVTISSSATDKASVAAGKVKGVAEGTATLSMSSDKVKVSGQMVVTVKKKDEPTVLSFNQDLTQPLTRDMIILPLGLQSGMQCIEVDKRGGFYMTNEDATAMRVYNLNKDGSVIGSEMVLPSGGHGDGFSMEYDSDEVYFWTSGSMGEHGSNGAYSGGKANDSDVRLICRHKFKAGVTEYAEEAEECFYLNDNGARFAEVDTEHDVMALWTYQDNSDWFYVYKLSEIRNAKKINIKVTRKSHNEGKEVSCYDLRTVKPISSFPWKRKGVVTGDTNSGAVQGLCVYDDKIYVESGAKNDEAMLVSVLDFQGNILQKLVKLGVTTDKQKLIDLNVSSDGTFEPEGMHIHKGEMYLGFVGDYPTSGSKKHCCIIKLK